jgi:hypothetical protein
LTTLVSNRQAIITLIKVWPLCFVFLYTHLFL